MSRRLIGVTVGAAVGVAILWFLLLWSPRTSDLDDARDRLEAAEMQNSQLDLRLRRLLALQEQAPALRSQLEELRAAVPDSPDLGQFILELDSVARASAVVVSTIAPTPPVAGASLQGPAEIALSLTVEGGYFQLLDFLNRMAAAPRLAVVDGLSIASSLEGSLVSLSVTMTARIFVSELVPLGSEPPVDDAAEPEPSSDEGDQSGGPVGAIDQARDTAEDAESRNQSLDDAGAAA